MPKKFSTAQNFLKYLNSTYSKLHTAYENAFWVSYMGDHSADAAKNKAEQARNSFRSDTHLALTLESFLVKAKGPTKQALLDWKRYFSLYQMPGSVAPLRESISTLESEILKKQTSIKEGYIDPVSGLFVEASRNKMEKMVATNPDEAIRKACFEALEKLSVEVLDLYVELIAKRNEFARAVGFEDFYAYKASIDENLSKKELFKVFDDVYDKTSYAFKDLRDLESTMPGLRKPWNFSYMMAGNFTKEEDPYFQFENALLNWGTSFSRLGVDYKKGTITLDLLDRKGKYSNGFCHWPRIIEFKGNKRIPGASNFTCNTILGQVGSGIQGLHTLFHEGGHAAHLLNSEEKQVCLNAEYAPMSVSWAETQSMFMDSISSSVEWKMRYAKTKEGTSYPFELFERRIRKLAPLRPLSLMSISFVVFFEKEIYECKNLTADKAKEIARAAYRKFFDRSEDSLKALRIPHIYSWESSAYYHGYGLAELAVSQWREHFFKKYEYIVDNPRVGKDMAKVWKNAARFSTNEFMKTATGKPLSAKAFLSEITRRSDEIIKRAKSKVARLTRVPQKNKAIDLNANISLVHGKTKIADNKKGFEDMDKKYRKWLAEMA